MLRMIITVNKKDKFRDVKELFRLFTQFVKSVKRVGQGETILGL